MSNAVYIYKYPANCRDCNISEAEGPEVMVCYACGMCLDCSCAVDCDWIEQEDVIAHDLF